VDKKEERNKGEEKVAKAPGAVHLVRRADYLLSVLKAKYSDNQAAKRAVENHHRNNKKHDRINGHRRSETRGSISASPAPQSKKHRPLDRDRVHSHGNSDFDSHRHKSFDSGSKPDMKRKHSGHEDDRHHDRSTKQRKSENGHSKSNQEQDSMLRVIFRPVRDSLRRVREATSDRIKSRKERASVMKVELVTIGNFIVNLSQEDEGKDLKGQFW